MLSIVLLVSLNLFHYSSAAIYCKDENGRNVDWTIVYKLPKIGNRRANDYFTDGLKYGYISGKEVNSAKKRSLFDGVKLSSHQKNFLKGKHRETTVDGWQLSSKQVTDANSIFGRTLSPVYNNPSKYTYLMYNDAPPKEEGSSHWAHAKGVVVMDSSTGIFLTHSIPNFPPKFNESYEYPSSAANNGQTALCISFKTQEEANNVLNHLLTLRPNIYMSSVVKNAPKDTSVLNELITKKGKKPSFATYKITSVNGVTFNTFSKSSKATGDLYSEHIAPILKTNIFVETWRKGMGTALSSNCSTKFSVQNVHELDIPFTSGKLSSSGKWLYTQDHAKWGISANENVPVTCIADINRMQSQFKRGGGSVCLQDMHVWQSFRKSIVELEACDKKG